jgi:hypothetical protein
MAATVAVHQTENSFRDKVERYLQLRSLECRSQAHGLCRVAAKMARVVHGIVKTGTASAASMKKRRQVEESLRTGRRGREDLVDNDPAFHLVES